MWIVNFVNYLALQIPQFLLLDSDNQNKKQITSIPVETNKNIIGNFTRRDMVEARNSDDGAPAVKSFSV